MPLLAEDIAGGFPDYPSGAQERRAHLEDSNFWFVYRSQVINWCLEQFLPNTKKMLELGCGTGFVLASISRTFPNIRLFGADAYTSALHYARERVPGAEFAQLDAHRLPFTEEFDLVGAFDVLEHIDDDHRALVNMNKSVRRGGGIILTVPQHPFLWSVQDEQACHKRRYTRRELKSKLEAAGFHILFMTSFITLLLPSMLASRWIKTRPGKSKPKEIRCELELPRPLNKLFAFVCDLEFYYIKKNISLPIGGSLICCAIKRFPD